MVNNSITVTKWDGRREPLNLNKFHAMVEEACDGLAGVSASQVEMNSKIQFYDGIKTKDIQNILIKSAADLISLDTPNYQYVAARLLMFGLRKDVFRQFEPVPLYEMIKRNIDRKVYDPAILDWYTKDEIDYMDAYLKYDRDYNFTYAGLRQLVDKYLVQDRKTGEVYEVPQIMYMMIAATLFHNYPKDIRMTYVKKYYDAISTFKLNMPTPVIAGVRTPIRQFASCVLVDVDDTLNSIFSSVSSVGYYTAARAGIGLNLGRMRGINQKIRNGEVVHTGVIPFLKVFEATVKSCQQNGVRGGSSTVHFPIWHQEIKDILVLKNNKGTEDNRVRKLDYSIQISKLFYERLIKNENITLFSPNNVPGLYEAFGQPEFDDLYRKYEQDPSIEKEQVSAIELFTELAKERADTGRIYIMNIDHANSHSSFLDPVYMSNLCQEITLPTKPLQHIDDEEGLIATCILSAINLGKVRKKEELELLCDLAVRGLEELIDFQGYPIKAAESFTKKYRALGIGYIGLAEFLAKNKVKYDDPQAWKLIHEITEAFQYYLLKASNQLAKEKGSCEMFSHTKYSKGILPIDTYKKDIDSIVEPIYNYDWEQLRNDILEHGLRHSTLSAQMPSESSSLVNNTTNGVEPPRTFLTVKKSKKTPLKLVVPGYSQYKNYYTLLWDMPDMSGYLNIMGIIQKFFDQAISSNTSYDPSKYEDNQIPISVFLKDILTAYKLGLKTLYYHLTYDLMEDESVEVKPIIEENVNENNNDSDEDESMCESCAI